MLGSSSRSSRGALMSARPMASICCSPPLRLPAASLRRAARMGKSSYMRARSARMEGSPRRVHAPSSRFSCTLSGARIARPSGTCTRPARTILSALRPMSSSPRNRMLPPDARTIPLKAWRVELLPAPFAPMRATIRPSSTVKEKPRTAWMPP